jgi:2-haloacid dehalogenase
MRLSDFKALSFDCYGTLIDWEAGLGRALQPLQQRSGAPVEELIERVHERLSRRLGIETDPEEARAFGHSIGDWPAFADSAEALAYLKQHFKLIILSNVDRASFARSNQRLGVEFDHVFTAEEIGSYKPDLRNFEYMLERLGEAGIAKGELLHTAQSLFHDHVPANRLGIASAWIDRRHDKQGSGATVIPDPMPHFDFRFTSLGELAAAHRAERG